MIPYLAEDQQLEFPPVEQALDDEDANGLLCAGGDLSSDRLIKAYQNGIFPWYSEGEPILWWSPDPRAVIFAENIHTSRSTQRTLNKGIFEIRHNTAFMQVVQRLRSSASPTSGDVDTT